MKKSLLVVPVLLAVLLASCGEKRMTEAQIEAEVTKQFDAQKAALQTAADESCTASKDAMVQTLTDSIYNAEITALTAESAAPLK